ncbi:MAG: thioredoxin domain-containing protein [Acidimicrobiia bacterium]|nr:thioredoxin domain-containing protein [Acidimicrobiia bacterium]
MPGANRLADASSPYLRQHAGNPVHWQEWSEDAFAEAGERQVPVLLSVGYASCHWCHVMAHESFEDPATADLMNRWFVNVKVDREERPDIDRIYMDAVQAMSGRGGWPMTVFLTPSAEPFFAGTYFPRADRPGHPSFTSVLTAIHEAWSTRRADLEIQARSLAVRVAAELPHPPRAIDHAALAAAYAGIRADFDPDHGGFGGAPKFPQAPTLEFLLRIAGEPWAPEAAPMLATSLRSMAAGGIHDHIGGGFARYSVDSRWAVPHFEKMLVDNAQLLRLYAHASRVTADLHFAGVARSIAAYLLTDLRLPEGGFASGEDADSEGEEGTFYVFTRDEVAEAAGPHRDAVADVLGVTATGNFEGRSVLQMADPAAVAERWSIDPGGLADAVAATLEALRSVRSRRTRPMLDDKVVAAWNGLAVRALAEASVVLNDPALLVAAVDAAEFVVRDMRDGDGRLHRSWCRGRLGPTGFCDDYGAMALGCFALYQVTGDERWFTTAADLTRDLVRLFADPDGMGFFATGSDAERLIARPKNVFDLPSPSDNALAAEAMLHMAAFTGAAEWWDRLEGALRLSAGVIVRHPAGGSHALAVAQVAAAPPLEVAVVGPDPSILIEVVHEIYRPRVFVAQGTGTGDTRVPLLAGRPAPTAGATAYVCRGFVCDAPITDPVALRAALG